MPESPLISPEELAGALATAAPPVLLDVRWSLAAGPAREAYLAGHLPGAVFVDLDRELSAPPGDGGRHPLPDPADFQEAMRRHGVRAGRPVVAYDTGDLVTASRAWWLLGYHGHEGARVLDGGFPAWEAAGLPLETAVPDPEPGDFVARPGQRPLVDAAGAGELARSGVLLDVRAAARYRGEEEPIDPVAGHVPGARSAPATDLLGPDGRLLPPAALRASFEAVGVRPGRPVGAYCGSGVTAAAEVLALEVAGYHAALYAGSWSEWVRDPSRPVATGSEP